MGRVFVVEREGRSYRCKYCNTQLALFDDLASRVCTDIWFFLNMFILEAFKRQLLVLYLS